MIEVEAEDAAWIQALPDFEALTQAAANAAIRACADQGEASDITILLTDDEAVRDLNHRFRDKDKATNVLSFPAHQTAQGQLGDIALAYGVCAQEAAEQGKPLAQHLQHLVVHGVLHLLGYDHEEDAEAEQMEDHERRILAALGVPDPYAPDPYATDHGAERA